MATTIATLTQKTDGSLEGIFATIRVNAPIAIVPNANKASEEAPDYRKALAEQAALANAILNGLGYEGTHVALITARDARDLPGLDATLAEPPAATVKQAASFATQADKRATLDLALDHQLAQAPQAPEEIALPKAGAPYGDVRVDTDVSDSKLPCPKRP